MHDVLLHNNEGVFNEEMAIKISFLESTPSHPLVSIWFNTDHISLNHSGGMTKTRKN